MSKRATLTKRAKEAISVEGETPPTDVNHTNKGNFDVMVSTGSTLLDLAISGGVTEEGGVPVGILMELYGPPASGKTAIISEMAGNALHAGGSAAILDPEGRLDHEHAKIYNLDITKTQYEMPDTVTEVFDFMELWEPENECGPNIIMTDSLAALSTNMEMKDDDAMGMRRAKEFSQGLRKICRKIKKNDWLIACTNQVRVNIKSGGEVTPGGMGIPFYASLRIRIAQAFQNKYLKKTVTINGVKQEKIYGIKSECVIKKSSIDAPYRSAVIYFIFDYGIDDVRANLEFLKENSSDTGYVLKNETYKSMAKAISVVEENDLEEYLKKKVIALWHEIQRELTVVRKQKRRE